MPVISPDGRKVVFTTATSDLYIAEESKAPRKLSVEARFAAWSPNGESLLLTTFVPGKRVADTRFFELETMDLRTGSLSAVPDSQGMLGGFWLTQGTLVAANSDFTKFRLFDFGTKNWRDLIAGRFVNWFVSLDGKYLYLTTGTADPQVLRVEIASSHVEPITSLKGLRRTVDAYSGTQVNVAPDGSPVFTRDIGTQEIYALDVRWK